MERSRSTRLLIPTTDQYQSMIDTPWGRSFHMDRGLPSRTSLDAKRYATPYVGTDALALTSGSCVEVKT
jgi:hypothetical protein